MKFRKKPVVVEAIQFTKEMAEGKEDLPKGVKYHARVVSDNGCLFEDVSPNYKGLHKHTIDTLEGQMRVEIGDWIITGVNGEHYPCRPDIFEKTYELVEE